MHMKTTKQQDTAYFSFLDDLRESGVTNMMGATPYLRNAFPDLTKAGAHLILNRWMVWICGPEAKKARELRDNA